MKVRALRNGWDGLRRRKAGEVFNYDGELGKWMEKVDDSEKAGKPQPAEAERDPATLKDIQADTSDRKAIMAQLNALGVSYFRGDDTDKLRALLAQQGDEA